LTQQDHATQDQIRPETSTGHYLLEVLGILCFGLLLLLIGVDVYQGMIDFGDLWLASILAVLAYLAADFLSGFVHFLADNFGSYDTPIIGPIFIEPFREHHIDPKGIVGNDFVDANGNIHKWAHMDTPPAFVGWLQAWGMILSREHTTTSITRAPTTPTTASPRGSGTLYWIAPASSSGWSV
jgi:hypothetical protein